MLQAGFNLLRLTAGPDLTNSKYLYYYNPSEWTPAAALNQLSSVCLPSCPDVTIFNSTVNLSNRTTWPVVCKYFSQSRFAGDPTYNSSTLTIDPW